MRFIQTIQSYQIGFPVELDVDINGMVKIKGETLPGNGRSPNTQYLCITIEDNGIGFDEKYIPRIFEVFQRFANWHRLETEKPGYCQASVRLPQGKPH